MGHDGQAVQADDLPDGRAVQRTALINGQLEDDQHLAGDPMDTDHAAVEGGCSKQGRGEL